MLATLATKTVCFEARINICLCLRSKVEVIITFSGPQHENGKNTTGNLIDLELPLGEAEWKIRDSPPDTWWPLRPVLMVARLHIMDPPACNLALEQYYITSKLSLRLECLAILTVVQYNCYWGTESHRSQHSSIWSTNNVFTLSFHSRWERCFEMKTLF